MVEFDGMPTTVWHEKTPTPLTELNTPLAEMLDMQRCLMIECDADLLDPALLLYITGNNIAGEAQEAVEFFGDITKPWKKNLTIDLDAVKGEFIDVLHFLLQVFVVLDMDEEEILKRYSEKNMINFQRIRSKMKEVEK